jgi:hypothetical protein
MYKYKDLDGIDVEAIKNPIMLSKKDMTYKLLRHTGVLTINKWAKKHNLVCEIGLAMKIIAINVENEYRRILKTESLIWKN